MSDYRIIIAGQLEFGSERVFRQVFDQYVHRMENYYKGDILLKPEDFFKEQDLILDVPRTVVNGSERHWLNTLNLLERVVSFSIAGSLNLWRLDAGTILDHHLLEPQSDRTTVQLFNQGRQLVNQEDKEEEALAMMTTVVDRFARHAQAYERRGFVNFRLGNLKDALYDYDKSLNIYPAMPESHYGRGLTYSRLEQWEQAAADFEAVTNNSIPHQAIYWMAQVALGDTYLRLGRPADAQRLFNLFSKRKQRIGSLDRYDRRVNYDLGKLLAKTGRYPDAHAAFELALKAVPDEKAPSEAKIHYHYGLSLKAAGQVDKSVEHLTLAAKELPEANEALQQGRIGA
ncbi:tetratricopeptide repeat protein [Neolewinella lacunae]|uniref:Tetratricopeptide repeat protein n=1 Tax=Neolewinella lacunae TaxID=1517758 RepID=A0A923PLG7_9BACT|nr:tetratricopeptide repeat protein [Neolewinella lacunae]MBC6992677.1 tetratricopeptide repeat protein [Neolewinella lacunae]MDN3633557.1 tetratricopeptide repeat protein [Neolewinella lacunae]